MANENDGSSNRGDPAIGASALREAKQPDSVPSKPATEADLQEVERKMSGFERSTLRWTRASFFIVLATAVFIALQWLEMRSGGSDTHDLAVAAGKQADRMKDFADRMKDQADRTKDLADQMKDQADRTKTIAEQAVIQAHAAKSAADTAKRTLHTSERAYLMLGIPSDDFPHKRTTIPLMNNGHIPSGPTKVVVHEITFRIDDPSAKTVPPQNIVEKHWRVNNYQTIPAVAMGSLLAVDVRLPLVVDDDIRNGRQGIMIVAVATYNDGFPGTPEQTYVFCDSSSYEVTTKLFAMRPCDDTVAMLPVLATLDEYPSAKYQEK